MLPTVARPVPVLIGSPLISRCASRSLSRMIVLAGTRVRPESTRLVPTTRLVSAALERMLGAALLGQVFDLDF